MKAIRILLCTVIVFAMLLPMATFAEVPVEDNFVDEIGEIDCPYGSPTVDGTISAAEGWSAAQYIDKTNTDGCWGGEEVVITGNIYRAWDAENLYIAADINIPELTICTGEDTLEGTEIGNRPGWNGDVFVYSIDPLQAFLNEGYNNDAAPWYCFGIFEGGEIKTYRTHLNDGEITEKLTAKGAVTDTGWRFEAALPWDLICKDVADYTYDTVTITPEIIAKAGNKISGSMIYYDRVFDPEQNGIITGSRYVTIAKTLPDGTPGIMCSGWILDAHGMHFMLSGGLDTNGADNGNGEGGTGGNTTTGNTNNGTTGTTNKPNTGTANKGNTTGAASPQTYDNAFGYAAIALFAAAIALHFIMKNPATTKKN